MEYSKLIVYIKGKHFKRGTGSEIKRVLYAEDAVLMVESRKNLREHIVNEVMEECVLERN